MIQSLVAFADGGHSTKRLSWTQCRINLLINLRLSRQQRLLEKSLGVGSGELAVPLPSGFFSVGRNYRAPKLRLDLLLSNVKIIITIFFSNNGPRFKERGHRYTQIQRDSIISRAPHGRCSYTKIIKITKRTSLVLGYSMISSRL